MEQKDVVNSELCGGNLHYKTIIYLRINLSLLPPPLVSRTWWFWHSGAGGGESFLLRQSGHTQASCSPPGWPGSSNLGEMGII